MSTITHAPVKSPALTGPASAPPVRRPPVPILPTPRPLPVTTHPLAPPQPASTVMPGRDWSMIPVHSMPAGGAARQTPNTPPRATGLGVPRPRPIVPLASPPPGGQPLLGAVRAPLERSFGVELAAVRVHNDAAAVTATRSRGLRAFAYGNHIILGAGESPTDLGLMAHEVTHVLQQRQGPVLQGWTPPGTADPREQEAHAAASAASQGQAATAEEAAAPLQLPPTPTSAYGWVADKLRPIPGYTVLAVLLGHDPVTDQPVPHQPVDIVHALLELVPHGLEIFANLQKAHVIEKAIAWVQQELVRLNLTWDAISQTVRQVLDSVSGWHPEDSYHHIKDLLTPLADHVVQFAYEAGKQMLEFIFEGVLAMAGPAAQKVLAAFRRVGQVFSQIIHDPVGFLRNLLAALAGGFHQFKDHILDHLKTGLFEWLFGALQHTGIQLPRQWDLRGILSVVVQVLGLSYKKVRVHLVKELGEPRVAALEKTFEFLRILVTEGLAGVWRKILEFANTLVDTVIGKIRDWVAQTVVVQAVEHLLALFTPVGAVVEAVLSIYNTIAFFIEKIDQIADLVNAILDSISNIATGNLGQAIAYVEKTLARTIPVIIGFLARLVHLGDVGERIRDLIKSIQASVDQAVGAMIHWLVGQVRKLFTTDGRGQSQPDERTQQQKEKDLAQAISESEALLTAQDAEEDHIRRKLREIKAKYRLSVLELVIDKSEELEETVHISGEINPKAQTPKQRIVKIGTKGRIDYGPSVGIGGRPHGITATITPWMVQKGGSSARRSIIPPGFPIGLREHGAARGHLLGNQLGGDGSRHENLVTLVQNPTNSPWMRDIETQVRQIVKSGKIVEYAVTPIYDLTDKNRPQELREVPISIDIKASTNGKLIIHEIVPNI